MSDSKNKPDMGAAAKQIAATTALAGAGSLAGYMGGGAVARSLANTPRFKKFYASLDSDGRKRLATSLRYGGAGLGTIASGLSAYGLHKALSGEDAQEKAASFFTVYAYTRLL